MTLSVGDLLIKVTRAEDGSFVPVKGEAQHAFKVVSHAPFYVYQESDHTSRTVEKADLEVVE